MGLKKKNMKKNFGSSISHKTRGQISENREYLIKSQFFIGYKETTCTKRQLNSLSLFLLDMLLVLGLRKTTKKCILVPVHSLRSDHIFRPISYINRNDDFSVSLSAPQKQPASNDMYNYFA